MTSRGVVVLADIWRMLDECAPGWTSKDGDHKTRVTYNGRVYPSLPQGPHGKRPGRGEIKRKYVKDLCEVLGILPCAQQHLEILR